MGNSYYHAVIFGAIRSGKTTLAQYLCKKYKRAGFDTAVLDPHHDGDWYSENLFTESEPFMTYLRNHSNLKVFIDEAPEFMTQFDREVSWITRMSHHDPWNHQGHIISQRNPDVNKTGRRQTDRGFIFRLDEDDTRELKRHFTTPEIERIVPQLRQYHFMDVRVYGGYDLYRLTKE